MPVSNTFLFFAVVIIFLLRVIIYSNSSLGFVGRRNLNYYSYPIFNLGTREWFPTHLQSHDVRGEQPITYYPSGSFNQPEVSARGFYPIIEPNFYTYEYVNPVQGFYPPTWNSNYSVPFKVDNSVLTNTPVLGNINSIYSSSNEVKPRIDSP
jgi:hypothetical protein